MFLLSRLLVLYKGAKWQISNIFTEVKGFTVNWCQAVLIQIYNKILLSWENYADTISIVVDFVNYNNGLKVSLGKDAFLLILKNIFNISKIAED